MNTLIFALLLSASAQAQTFKEIKGRPAPDSALGRKIEAPPELDDTESMGVFLRQHAKPFSWADALAGEAKLIHLDEGSWRAQAAAELAKDAKPLKAAGLAVIALGPFDADLDLDFENYRRSGTISPALEKTLKDLGPEAAAYRKLLSAARTAGLELRGLRWSENARRIGWDASGCRDPYCGQAQNLERAAGLGRVLVLAHYGGNAPELFAKLAERKLPFKKLSVLGPDEKWTEAFLAAHLPARRAFVPIDGGAWLVLP